MKRLLTFIFLTTFLSLSEQSFDSESHAAEQVAVKGNVSVPRSPPDDYEFFPNIGYYKIVTQLETFRSAVLSCERDGGHLAIINSMEEADAILSVYRKIYVAGQGWPTLGFGDFYEKGYFRTIFGEPMSSTGYTYWYPGEPAITFERNCGCLDISGGMGAHCCDCPRMYFCEIELSSVNVSN